MMMISSPAGRQLGFASERRSKPSAFTLIELLIVIAIIAILALIAIPNMLEAQTRSKVSRVRADMRTVATALEAYATDHNHYPTFHLTLPTTEFFIGGTAGPGMVIDPNFTGNPQITTPIAYLSSIPRDVFFAVNPPVPPERSQFMYVNWRYARDRGVDTPASFDPALQAYGDWQLLSGGPTQIRDLGPANGEQTIPLYDPTNGTVSRGMLIRSAVDPIGRPLN